jgi:hypothetical protein
MQNPEVTRVALLNLYKAKRKSINDCKILYDVEYDFVSDASMPKKDNPPFLKKTMSRTGQSLP